MSLGNPYWVSKVANPRPCNSPKVKTTNGRHFVVFLKKVFSKATQTIDKKISGSTTDNWSLTKPSAARASVMLCAKVNAVTCNII